MEIMSELIKRYSIKYFNLNFLVIEISTLTETHLT